KAQGERDHAVEARAELRRTVYATSMNLIPAAWEAHDVRRVISLLDELRPGDGEDDLRGFEWHYWDRRCHAERRSVTIRENSSLALTFCGDGSRFLVGGSQGDLLVNVIDSGQMSVVRSWRQKMEGPGSGGHGSFNHDGTRLVFGATKDYRSGRVWVW